ASGPHCALRKSFHFIFFAEPSAWADLYFALHSFMVSAEDGVANASAPSRETDARIVNCLIMIFSSRPPGANQTISLAHFLVNATIGATITLDLFRATVEAR